PQVVVGGPGTGKTEFLVRRTLALLADGAIPTSSILLLSFGRRGVSDLRHRIRSAAGSLGDLDVATFHSYAIRLLEAYGSLLGWTNATQVLTGPEQQALVAELLRSEDRAHWSNAFAAILSTHTFAEELTDFVLRAAEQLLTPADVAARRRDDWKGIPEFLARYDAELVTRQRIDYGTLLREAVRLVEMEALPVRPGYVLVDEYQDTTLAQARLLAALTHPHNHLTVAADPYQSVYSFRGARLENVVEFPEAFRSADGEPGKRIVLTTSFRAPTAILDSAVNVTARVLPGAAGRVTPTAAEGRVDVHIFGQQTEESEWVASEVERIHLTQGVPLREIGVVVRSKRRFLPELSRALERRGIAHDLPDSRLSDHPAVRFVLDLIAAVDTSERPAERSRAMRRILLGPMYRVPLGELRRLEYRAADDGGWPEALEEFGQSSLAALLTDTGWAADIPAEQGAWHVWSQLDEAVAIVTDPARNDERLAWRSLVQVLSRWNERNPSATLVDYRSLTESEDFEAQPLLSFRRPQDDRLAVTTLHQSKGLEFHTIFICDAVEGVFPDLRPRDSLLGVRHLLDHLPTDSAAYTAFRLQEERRLAYTAMTRARNRVVWTATSVGAEAGRGVPSRFLPLVAGVGSLKEISSDTPDRGAPVSPREAEAQLRRIAADPIEAAPARLAAVSVLADGQEWGLRPGAHHVGVASRGPDSGLNGKKLRLSPSEADGYARCPRRYALERKLYLAADSLHATFGSLIHQVLDDVESEAMLDGKRHSDFAAAKTKLDELMDPAVYGGEPFAAAWRERALEGLERLYALWPSSARPVGIERGVSFTLGDVTWRGRIDRIEVDEDGVRVVDYKTTRHRTATTKEAQESLQLGFYALAVGADEELRQLGEPVAAEFWYPLADATQKLRTRSLDLANLPEIGQRLIQLGEDIASERWEPVTGDWCDRCAFATSCPARPEGGDQFA
ncbi:MAG: ATP-dependent helicase, partial [Acidimicrobiia bacterium]|nr:ATP-dependent helicase [Acidimicrobiia bacterium]